METEGKTTKPARLSSRLTLRRKIGLMLMCLILGAVAVDSDSGSVSTTTDTSGSETAEDDSFGNIDSLLATFSPQPDTGNRKETASASTEPTAAPEEETPYLTLDNSPVRDVKPPEGPPGDLLAVREAAHHADPSPQLTIPVTGTHAAAPSAAESGSPRRAARIRLKGTIYPMHKSF